MAGQGHAAVCLEQFVELPPYLDRCERDRDLRHVASERTQASGVDAGSVARDEVLLDDDARDAVQRKVQGQAAAVEAATYDDRISGRARLFKASHDWAVLRLDARKK